MQATARRRDRKGRGDLRVVSAHGVTAEFVTELAAEAEVSEKRRRWTWNAGARRNLRRSFVVLGLVAAAFTAAVLLNIGPSAPGEPGANSGSGHSSVASAARRDCISDWVPNFIEVPIEEICGVIGDVVDGIKSAVVDPIVDGIWAAFNQNRFCHNRTSLSPQDPNGGINNLLSRGVGILIGNDIDRDKGVTTWEQFGSAGAFWDTYFLDCWDTNNLINTAANFIFYVSKLFAVIAILLFQQTFTGKIVDYFFTPQHGASISEIDRIIQRLNYDVYLQWSAVAILLGAAVVLYFTIIRGGGLADGLGKIGTMAFVSGLALAFVAEGSHYVQEGNNFTNTVGATVLSALAGTQCTNSDGNNVNAEPYNCSAQTLYDALIFRPWAGGNIGELDRVDDQAGNKQRRELAMRILRQNAYTPEESKELSGNGISIEEQRRRGKDPANIADRQRQIIENKKNDRLDMVKSWGVKFISKDHQSAGDFDPNSWRPFDHVEAEQQDYWLLWTGGRAGQRVLVAFMGLMAAMTLGMMMLTLSVAYLSLQLMTILLAMAAPLVFVVALIPVFGFMLLLRWASLFIGMFIKRLAIVVFIGLVLAMLHVIFAIAIPWWIQLILIIGVCLVGLSYRKQFANWASGGMSGVGAAAGVLSGGGVLGVLQARQTLKDARKGWHSSQGLNWNDRARVAMSSGYASLEGRDPVVNAPRPTGASGVRSRTPNRPMPPPQSAPRPRNRPIGQRLERGMPQQPGSSNVPQRGVQDPRRNQGYVYQRDSRAASAPPPRRRTRASFSSGGGGGGYDGGGGRDGGS